MWVVPSNTELDDDLETESLLELEEEYKKHHS